MKHKLIILLLLSAILLLAACDNGSTETVMYEPLSEDESHVHVKEEPSLEEEIDYDNIPNYTTIQATDEIQITIAYVTDELLSQYESFDMFYLYVDSQADDGIAFIPNVPVLNFRYIKINGAEVMFIVEEDLLALDVLLPETPLLVDWTATGSMAYGGFAFEDENGLIRYFAFN